VTEELNLGRVLICRVEFVEDAACRLTNKLNGNGNAFDLRFDVNYSLDEVVVCVYGATARPRKSD
jgi:hypothetical protein